MKEEMNSFDVTAVTDELQRLVCGFRILNVYQINPKTLLLKLRGAEGAPAQLLIEAGKRVHLTSYVLGKPLKPPDFCMVLRKYLNNGVIETVQQHDFERLIFLAIKNKGERFHLVVEIFGDGNTVLVDSQHKILQALSYRRMKDRNILRGEVFAFPPPRGLNPEDLDRAKFDNIISLGSIDVVRGLARFLSISGLYAEEILIRAGIGKNTHCGSLTDLDLDVIFDSLRELLSKVKLENKEPCIVIDDRGNWVDVTPFSLRTYLNLKSISVDTFNKALDEYYSKASVSAIASDVKADVDQEISRLERILSDQEENLRNLRTKAEICRNIGNLIYSHLSDLEILSQRIMKEKRSGKDWADITEVLLKEKGEGRGPAIYFQTVKPETVSLEISADGQTFDCDLRQSVQKNAAEYYGKAKKAKEKIEGVETAIRQTRERIDKTRVQVAQEIENASKPLTRERHREWYEKFHWFYSSDGFLVIGGRDASTNESLIKKHTEPQDTVFHADIAGAPFVLVKTQGRTISESSLKEAASFAASYSRAWKGGFRAMDVYWIRPEQVSKTPPSGQYLPTGSFMIYGTKNYIKNTPLEIAIGLIKEDDGLRVIGGPTEAISKQTKLYARIIPGNESSGKLAKRIKEYLARLVSEGERRKIFNASSEEIQRFMPSGQGTIR